MLVARHGTQKAGGEDLNLVSAADEVGDGVALLGERIEMEDVGVAAAGELVAAGAAGQRVLPEAALQRVVAGEPGQLVGAVVADDEVGERVADAVDCAGAGQGQSLDVEFERM